MAAATDFSLTAGMRCSGYLVGGLAGQKDTAEWGVNSWNAPDLAFTFGTGNNQCKEWFRDQRSVATVTADNLDMSGVIANTFGTTIIGLTLRFFALAIDAPDGTKKLQVGPRGVVNTAQLWFGGTGATVYEEIYYWGIHVLPITGWTITAGTGDLLGIYNPTAGSVTYRIWLGFTI